jgi:membrane-bound lytic murein transglycosylase A
MKICGNRRLIRTLILVSSLTSFSSLSFGELIQTPTKRLHISKYPAFIDDLNFDWMEIALDRQIERFAAKELTNQIKLGDDVFPEKQMFETAKEFRKLVIIFRRCLISPKIEVKTCRSEFEHSFIGHFNVYEPALEEGDPGNGKENNAFFTGYNTPTLNVTSTKNSRYQYGIYAKPADESLRTSTRNQIDFQRLLEPTKYTLFYADDLFRLYLLHIEGGGKVIVNGSNNHTTEYYLTFDGTNSQSFKWLSTYMVEHGMLDPKDRSIEAQRVFLRENPSKWEEIYSSCPSYVYFKLTDTPPNGSDEVSLTDNRSMATDRLMYKAKGLLAFVIGRRPVEVQPAPKNQADVLFRDFSRFYIDQDTGGAIKGKARADLYFGEGDYAQLAGENIKDWGKIFFIMKKI